MNRASLTAVRAVSILHTTPNRQQPQGQIIDGRNPSSMAGEFPARCSFSTMNRRSGYSIGSGLLMEHTNVVMGLWLVITGTLAGVLVGITGRVDSCHSAHRAYPAALQTVHGQTYTSIQ